MKKKFLIQISWQILEILWKLHSLEIPDATTTNKRICLRNSAPSTLPWRIGLMVYQMIILFVKKGQFPYSRTKTKGKVLNRLQRNLFYVKLTICKRTQNFCYLYLFREKVVNISIYMLSTGEMWHFDDNFVRGLKHILFTNIKYLP